MHLNLFYRIRRDSKLEPRTIYMPYYSSCILFVMLGNSFKIVRFTDRETLGKIRVYIQILHMNGNVLLTVIYYTLVCSPFYEFSAFIATVGNQ